MVFFPPLSFLERLGAVGNLLVDSESACGFLGGWVGAGVQGSPLMGREKGAAGASAGPLGLEAGGLAENCARWVLQPVGFRLF